MQRSMRKVQGKLYRVALCLLFVVISGTLYYRQKASKPEKRLYDALENSTMKSQDEGPMRLCGLQSKFEEEGHLGDNLTLSSVFILVRHGERGPFNPILNSRNTHCGISAEEDNLKFKKYKRDISLVPLKDESFHQFDRTPPAGNWCRPGHLTTHGAFQHLSLGRSLREAYVTETGIPLAITVYLTHFARTFQSALALLFGLLGENVSIMSSIPLQEVPSIDFCFDHCKCPITKQLEGDINQHLKKLLKNQTGIMHLIGQISRILRVRKAMQDASPLTVREALVPFLCHRAAWPCLSQGECIQATNLSSLHTYIEWSLNQVNQAAYELRGYGLMKHVLQTALSRPREEAVQVVIYSGHDYTVRNMLAFFGIPAETPAFAARIVWEFYHSSGTVIGFRVLYDGKDITRMIAWCNSSGHSGNLCPIETAAAYLQHGFVQRLGATSFAGACKA